VLEADKMFEGDSQKPEIHVISSSPELVQNVYNILQRAADSCRRAKRPQIIIGLSGGSLIKTLADVLPSLNEDYLQAVRFIFCDERKVPFDDPESTYGQYMKMVLPSLQPTVSKEQFISINPNLSVDECAKDYEQKLRSLVGESQEWPDFDVLLLGLGPDGHTCSLFPGHPLLKEQGRWVAPVSDSPKPPPERVTLTLPCLTNAHRVVFVATGAAKADVVKQVLEGSTEEKERFPAALVKPSHRCGRVYWLLDGEAASKLTNTKSAI